MTTHITYKTAKALKEFLGESAPEPRSADWYSPSGMLYKTVAPRPDSEFPSYQLHDLLSKPFMCAMEKKMYSPEVLADQYDEMEHYHQILNAYVDGGLPAVEAELMRMMGREG